MHSTRSRFAFVIFLLLGVVASGRAAIAPASDREPFTAKELAQGHREHVILAKPLARHRATIDADETREGVHTRVRFARFGDLRVIELDDTDSVEAAIARLQATGRYEFVEPDHIYHADVVPNDPNLTTQWALINTGQSGGVAGADIKAPAAWDIIHDAPNVVVAVLDTGINVNHQDFAGNIWVNPSPTFGDINGARFSNTGISRSAVIDGQIADDNTSGHGTHVAGTIGAVGNNGLNVAGVAWRVQLMAVKVLAGTGGGSTSDIVNGIRYAIDHGAHIINASLGEDSSSPFDQSLFSAIAGARNSGVIFVAAAGNDSADSDLQPHYPSNFALDNIVSVGSSQRNDFVSTFSNYGAAVDLFAPGESIVSLSNADNSSPRVLSGTSMAAPHVSGALALLKARFPADTYRQLVNRLLRGAEAGARFAGKVQTGGRLNLLNALTTSTNRPFNDDFSARARLIGENFLVRSSNTDASAESGEPAHAGLSGGASLWWEWTPSSTATVRVTTTGSGYDTLLAIYTGNALGSLTLVAANDDSNGATTSRIDFTAQAGVTYQIAVDGKNGATGLTLLNIGSVPSNDTFATPVTLQGLSDTVTATNANCTRETGEPKIAGFSGGTSLWYQWTAPKSGRTQIAVTSADFDPLLAVYTGTAVNATTLVAANDNASATIANNSSLCTFTAIAGTTYRITVDAKSGTGQFVLTLNDSLWQAVATSTITGAPAVASDGTVYVGSSDQSLYAFAADGTLKWSYPTNGIIDTCSPALAADGTIYVGSSDGKLYALNPDGTSKWTQPHDFNSGTANPVGAGDSPAVAADGTIYIKISDGFLYAINPADGSVRWKSNVNASLASFYGTPIIAADGTIYQGSDENDAKLYAINPDGSPKWNFPADSGIYATPALDAAGNIYFCTLTGGVYSVTPAGTQRWRVSSGGNISSSPALSADGATLYYGGYDKKLYARSTATGASRWTLDLGNEVRASSPAVDANGVIYLGCYDNKLYAVSAAGALVRTWATGDIIRSCPAIFGTSLYLGSNDGKLYAFDVGTSAASGPWSQYRANVRRLGRAVAETFAITVQPQSQGALLGQSLTLGVTATGSGLLTYQWNKDGVAIPGATLSTYALTFASAANAGAYTVTVTGAQGSLTSRDAIVALAAPSSVGRLINLSILSSIDTPGGSFTLGTVVGGGGTIGTKPLVVRAVGPSLATFGVTGVLQQPRLTLMDGPEVVASNSGWGGSAELAAAMAQVGAFALVSPGSNDSALSYAVTPGNHTVGVSTSSTGSGTVLAEIYDATPTAAFTTVTPRLINVSVLKEIGSGLTAGFVVGGTSPLKVLVRAVGPTLALAPFRVPGTVAAVRLELFDSNSQSLGTNAAWAGAPALATVFAQVGAFALSDPNSKDAALFVTLTPGNYTAQVKGVNGGTGVALVEIYEVP